MPPLFIFGAPSYVHTRTIPRLFRHGLLTNPSIQSLTATQRRQKSTPTRRTPTAREREIQRKLDYAAAAFELDSKRRPSLRPVPHQSREESKSSRYESIAHLLELEQERQAARTVTAGSMRAWTTMLAKLKGQYNSQNCDAFVAESSELTHALRRDFTALRRTDLPTMLAPWMAVPTRLRVLRVFGFIMMAPFYAGLMFWLKVASRLAAFLAEMQREEERKP